MLLDYESSLKSICMKKKSLAAKMNKDTLTKKKILENQLMCIFARKFSEIQYNLINKTCSWFKKLN